MKHGQNKLTINPEHTTLSFESENRYYKNSEGQQRSKLNLRGKTYLGEITAKSKQKIITRMNWFWHIAKIKSSYNPKYNSSFNWKLNFITLTLSSKQIHDDKTIKRILLNEFIQTAKRKWGLGHYIWRAEAQANRRIHFHIISDIYIDRLELQREWNYVQNRLGYIDRYRGDSEPNSTDIHSIKSYKEIISHTVKYIYKKEIHRRKIKGKIWESSRSLEVLDKVEIYPDYDQQEEWDKAVEQNKIQLKKFDWCSIAFLNLTTISKKFSWIKDAIHNYLIQQWYSSKIKTKKQIQVVLQTVKKSFMQCEIEFTSGFA